MAGRARGLTIRGRGFVDLPPLEPLRRPGELRQPNPCTYANVSAARDVVADLHPQVLPQAVDLRPQELDDIFKELNTELVNDAKLVVVAGSLKSACPTSDSVKEAVEKVYKYSLLNKVNAHYGALLCKFVGDFHVENVKFKISLFKRLQADYEDRKRKYANLDQFLNIVAVLCEIYHHLRIANGSCYNIFVSPIIEYLGMLVDGGSEKEIEMFVEQVMKCGRNLQNQDPDTFETLVLKIRKQIIGISSVSSRNMLLQVFEMILNRWNPPSTAAKNYYNAVCKQIISDCE